MKNLDHTKVREAALKTARFSKVYKMWMNLVGKEK